MSDWIDRERERRQQGAYRVGTVVAVSDAEGLDVAVAGGVVTGVQYLQSYSAPGVGDRVALLYAPGQYFALGKFGTTGVNLGPNLLTNPGFELGLVGQSPSGWSAGWSPGGTGVEWWDEESDAHSSGASARADAGSLTTGEVRRLQHLNATQVTSGATYRLSGWFRATEDDPNTLIQLNVVTAPSADEADYFTATGLSFDVVTVASSPVWTEIAGLRTIPADHNYIRVAPSVVANAGHAADYVFMDDVSLRKQL